MIDNSGQTPKAVSQGISRTSIVSRRGSWPITPRFRVVWTFVLLVGLSVGVAILRATVGWPSDKSENVVLIALLMLSLLPILVPLLDSVIDRGGVIEYGGVKIDFSQVRPKGASGITVPVNVGVRSQSVTASDSTHILDALRQATAADFAVIDLEAGQAWWETRLLVLLAGAFWHRKPEIIVFVGTEAGRAQCFQGWAYAGDLLPQLARAHPEYRRCMELATAVAANWGLVEPSSPDVPGSPALIPPWMQGRLAAQYSGMAFESVTGLHNEFLAEQLLAVFLGQFVEITETPRSISLVRLEDLFKPVLYKASIDHSWPSDRQNSSFFESNAPYVAVTQQGTYITLISRLTVLNDMVRSTIESMQAV